jgi:Transposase DDE domain
LGLDLAVPDHSTLSRRAETLEVPKPCLSSREPVHLLVDSTGLRLCGPGGWLIEKHGTKRRRSWRKLHIGIDAETGQILASELTTSDVDDGSQVEPLLDQIAGPLASFTGDGAYDQAGVYGTVGKHYPDAEVIVPPRSTAVLSENGETAPTQRDRDLQSTAVKRTEELTPQFLSSADNCRAWTHGLAEGIRVHASCPRGVSYRPA